MTPLPSMGLYTRDITIEPGQVVIPEGPDTTIVGNAPPGVPKSWWPWIVAAVAIGGVWYLTREKRGGAGPLAGGGG